LGVGQPIYQPQAGRRHQRLQPDRIRDVIHIAHDEIAAVRPGARRDDLGCYFRLPLPALVGSQSPRFLVLVESHVITFEVIVK
jgi:hypothetical protein